jgi:ornithine--oxo-acid transaminase
MEVFHPGDHGSTFGGNPLGAAVGEASLAVILDENLPDRSLELGTWLQDRLREIDSPHILEVRGRGLMIGIEIRKESGPARPFCTALMERGVLCNDTHHQVIRIAPPLVVSRDELEMALEVITEVVGAGSPAGAA